VGGGHGGAEFDVDLLQVGVDAGDAFFVPAGDDGFGLGERGFELGLVFGVDRVVLLTAA
jgi:hypothetical protein